MNSIKRNDLEIILKRLENCRGPFVIIGRPHSGTRALAKAFIKNGIFMGSNVSEGFLDDADWYRRFVIPMITSRFFPEWELYTSNKSFKKLCDKRIKDTLDHFINDFPHDTWGWKLSETLFVMPLVKSYLSTAKFIHVIRDGRDVVLSDNGFFQLTSPTRLPENGITRIKRNLGRFRKNSYRNFLLRVTFNHSNLKKWRGINVSDQDDVLKNRFTLQMQSWMNCINTARKYSMLMQDSYYEIQYEDLCANPLQEVERLFEFMNITMRPETLEYLATNVHSKAVGKWKNPQLTDDEYKDFQNAVEFGKPLLEELGYM